LNIRAIGVIPSRYGSTRLPGKPLLDIAGKPLIQHVWERVRTSSSLDQVIVATDDRRVFDAVEAFGGRALMTSPSHTCGTERVAEAASHVDADAIVNVQGDEPEITSREIDSLVAALSRDPASQMATLAFPSTDSALYRDPNAVKVVLDCQSRALYFSRSTLPGTRSGQPEGQFLIHRGIYAYTKDFLLQFAQLPPSSLELREGLEQLRALENGFSIKVILTDNTARGIDTPEDYKQFLARMKAHPK